MEKGKVIEKEQCKIYSQMHCMIVTHNLFAKTMAMNKHTWPCCGCTSSNTFSDRKNCRQHIIFISKSYLNWLEKGKF